MLSIPPLNDEVFERVRRKNPGELPTRPLDGPDNDCKTCGGTKRYRWLADPEAAIVPVRKQIPKPGRPDEIDTYFEVEIPEITEFDCICRDQFRLQAYLLAHNLGKGQARTRWADASWVPPELIGPVREYAAEALDWASRGTGLFLHGSVGSGKSMLATMVLKSFLGAGIEGYWVTFNEMLSMHTSAWRDKDERDWFEQRVRNAQVLVIDDIGKESHYRPIDENGKQLPTNWAGIAATALDSTFRSRVQNAKVTIITSNKHPDQISMDYSAALGSLCSEACLPYEFPSLDVRELFRERVIAEGKNKLTRPFTVA